MSNLIAAWGPPDSAYIDGDTKYLTDTAGEIGSRGERGEAGGAGGGARDRPEPVGQAGEVDRGRGRDVLEMGPGQAAVAAAAQAEARTPCEIVPSIPARRA